MKRIIYITLIISLIFVNIFIMSCKKDDKEDNEGSEPNTPIVDDSTKEDDKAVSDAEAYILANTPTTMIESTDLIKEYEKDKEVKISWKYNTSNITKVSRDSKKIVERVISYHIEKNSSVKEGNITVTVYPKSLTAIANSFISQVPTELWESIDYLTMTYLNIYQVTWTSSDTDVLDNNGIYYRPTVDTNITISYKVSLINDSSVFQEGSFEITVKSYSDQEKVELVSAWLSNEVVNELAVSSDLTLPKVDPLYGVELTWTTSNSDIVDTEGKITRYVYDRYAEINCVVQVGNFRKDLTYWIKVLALDIEGMTTEQILDNFIKGIAVTSLKHVGFNINSGYSNITQSFNVLSFFSNEWIPKIEHFAPVGNSNRPGTIKNKVFICVHDTANNSEGATALMHAKYVDGGGGGTSFQYCVGNDGIYNLIPDNEVAYHAGDGTKYDFKLYDTGVKATSTKCNMGISEDGYFTFNGKKSKIKIPADTEIPRICEAGLYYEIGTNGNYWLNENYYNDTYGAISNRGGNNNSIGIETCVNAGSDYYITYMYNANNVARLCTEHNISVDNVLQHNNFSNKPCPNAIRQTGMWQPFRDYVSQIVFGMKTFKGLTFEYHSQTDILNDQGYIKRVIGNATEVKYEIIVKDSLDNVLHQKIYTTSLIKK